MVKRRQFSKEFKIEAVRLVRERGVSVVQAAKDLDVHENVLRKWVPEGTNVVCIRIRQDSGIKLYRHGTINIGRGVGWVKSPRMGYLWTKGYVPRLQTYAGREVPNPLAIEISMGEADMQQVMADVLALTKLNYNACIYGNDVPVTLRFADSVGEILTAAPRKNELPPLPFRYYI